MSNHPVTDVWIALKIISPRRKLDNHGRRVAPLFIRRRDRWQDGYARVGVWEEINVVFARLFNEAERIACPRCDVTWLEECSP
jgi:hypothetical protein